MGTPLLDGKNSSTSLCCQFKRLRGLLTLKISCTGNPEWLEKTASLVDPFRRLILGRRLIIGTQKLGSLMKNIQIRKASNYNKIPGGKNRQGTKYPTSKP